MRFPLTFPFTLTIAALITPPKLLSLEASAITLTLLKSYSSDISVGRYYSITVIFLLFLSIKSCLAPFLKLSMDSLRFFTSLLNTFITSPLLVLIFFIFKLVHFFHHLFFVAITIALISLSLILLLIKILPLFLLPVKMLVTALL